MNTFLFYVHLLYSSHVAWSRFTSTLNMNEVWTDLLYGFGVFGGTLSQRDLSKEFPSWYTLGLPLLSGEQISAKDIIREHLSKPEDNILKTSASAQASSGCGFWLHSTKTTLIVLVTDCVAHDLRGMPLQPVNWDKAQAYS